ncbi:hypothetical protein T12_7005 [Trichinella patagoniensis]|uniref:Uncharacterized protein n=1 Tax=Trichinella patagoniensis TaxID=990121 RepID=A0A0V0Z7E5_9BILA|nr:hypothetical protein T12_7005 [Trichinella patagoniensis]
MQLLVRSCTQPMSPVGCLVLRVHPCSEYLNKSPICFVSEVSFSTYWRIVAFSIVLLVLKTAQERFRWSESTSVCVLQQ